MSGIAVRDACQVTGPRILARPRRPLPRRKPRARSDEVDREPDILQDEHTRAHAPPSIFSARNSVGSSFWSPPSDFLMSLSPVKSACVTMPPDQVSLVSPSSSNTNESRRPSRHSQAMKLSTGWFIGLACSRSFLAPCGQMTYATVVQTYSALRTIGFLRPRVALVYLKLPSRWPDQPRYSTSALRLVASSMPSARRWVNVLPLDMPPLLRSKMSCTSSSRMSSGRSRLAAFCHMR
mmetsp:Transcript_74418/g.192007  ORF Transcript_74418/g.192007 Transcript_74418/m.192007 type:complete len:236 (+) Transcript_74418:140-847(+)